MQDAADHAIKTIQQRSNSLVPYQLQEIVHANVEVCSKFKLISITCSSVHCYRSAEVMVDDASSSLHIGWERVTFLLNEISTLTTDTSMN